MEEPLSDALLPPSCTCPMIACLLFFSCLAVALIADHLVWLVITGLIFKTHIIGPCNLIVCQPSPTFLLYLRVGLLLAPSNFTGCHALQHLQCLSLCGCSEMSDSCLTIMQSYALKLPSHNLDCCFGITDNGLSLVAASCSSLEVIGLYRSNITWF